MLDDIVLGKYYNTKSDIHDLNPLAKIICMLIFIVSILLVDDINIIFIMFTFELIIYCVTNIPLKIIYKNIVCLKYLIIFIILINIIVGYSITSTIIMLVKIISITLYSSMFTLTTTSKKIINGLNQLLYPLKTFKIKTEVVALIISLALQFIPITLAEANRILKNLKSRGLSDDSSFKSKIIGLKALIIPLYLSSFRKADVLADTMELRFYSLNNKKPKKTSKWNYLDIFFTIIHVIIILIVLKEVVL